MTFVLGSVLSGDLVHNFPLAANLPGGPRKGFATLNTTIRRLDGKVLALSSQTPEQVHRIQRELRLPYEVHGDPSNEVVEEMNRR